MTIRKIANPKKYPDLEVEEVVVDPRNNYSIVSYEDTLVDTPPLDYVEEDIDLKNLNLNELTWDNLADYKIIKAQPWYQMKTLSSPADIVIGWWAAWSWKTYSLLLEWIKCFDYPWFRWIIFRKTSVQIRGGWWLWDESKNIYSAVPYATPKDYLTKWIVSKPEWNWKTAEMKFWHMNYDKDMYSHQWLQYAFIWFDELTHFSEASFLYLMSRNRSVCGVKPFIRCTCNPDPFSWVRKWIERYLDEDWFVIKERDWVIRYFTMDDNVPIWGMTPQEVIDKCPHIFNPIIESWEDPNLFIKSFTFIEWDLSENKELLDKDKTYKANLMALWEQEKKALLMKCWNPVQDDSALLDYDVLSNITTNYLDNENEPKYISVDVAWYWKDLAIIMIWKWFEVIRTEIYKKSSPEDLLEAIERNRMTFYIPKTSVVYDNSWMWWGLAWRDYVSFNWNAQPIEYNKQKEWFRNLKTQCYYRMIVDIINNNKFKIDENEIYVDWKRATTIQFWSLKRLMNIVWLIKEDLISVRRWNDDKRLVTFTIKPKEYQKELLWRSPDFGDTIMMRFFFELKRKKEFYIKVL